MTPIGNDNCNNTINTKINNQNISTMLDSYMSNYLKATLSQKESLLNFAKHEKKYRKDCFRIIY